MTDEEQQAAVEALEEACEEIQTPLQRFVDALHGWVTFVVMPLFALANAGVVLSRTVTQNIFDSVSLGIFFGLTLGKPIGVMFASWLAVRTRVASLPMNVTWRHIHGASWLAGIGFTMSLFIAALAFGEASDLDVAKVAIFCASLCAGLAGSGLLLRTR